MRGDIGLYHVGKLHELCYGELFGAFGHDVLLEESVVGLHGCEELTERYAQHLTPLSEDSLYQSAEQAFVAVEMVHLITCHTYDGTLHFGRRIEHMLVNGEEIFHVIPRLNEYRQDAVGLRPGCGSHALCHFSLYHSRAAGDEVAVVEHLEKYLRGDVVGIVACEDEGLTLEHFVEVHAQEVLSDDVLTQLGVGLIEVCHRLSVNLNGFDRAVFLDEILRQHAHSWPYLEHRNVGTCVYRVGYLPCYVEVDEEVLPQILFRCHTFHICKGSASRAENQAKKSFFACYPEAQPPFSMAKGHASRAENQAKKSFFSFVIVRVGYLSRHATKAKGYGYVIQLIIKALVEGQSNADKVAF